ncbi:hypothetical protein BRADI_1g56837v3 [Brachypodium distachyon]|uniref:Ubiquitin-like protease family profile domain-containing protein n=1 Tax=Brachypodium distachyon TaxID=15368 RepID=A0A2K2DRW5_BRADI|nr:hypothetical protein BRADI_1g56837v3 [Brachypodium distachyon]PNT77015.1 hypothetical protein BRADI_1g56837v3 [Brachypodium distachyon]
MRYHANSADRSGSLPGPMVNNLFKRSQNNSGSAGDTSSDCTSTRKNNSVGRIVQIWPPGHQSEHGGMKHSCSPLTAPAAEPAKGAPTCRANLPPQTETTAYPLNIDRTPVQPDSASPLDNSGSSTFKTPDVLKPLVTYSPTTMARLTSESGFLARLLDTEESLKLDARALDSDFADTPIKRVTCVMVSMARNPWIFGAAVKPRPPEFIDGMFDYLAKDTSSFQCRWIIHAHPRVVDISGLHLKNIFVRNQTFSYDAFDIAIRRFTQLDRNMYGEGQKKCWRHIFESDFVMYALANEDPISERSIREKFISRCSDYEISECKMLVLPGLVVQTWWSYFWDMRKNLVHILDPTYHEDASAELTKLHDHNVQQIQNYLSKCIELLFKGWQIDWTSFKNNYVMPFVPGCRSVDSGLATLLAIRDFDGTKFVTPSSEVCFEDSRKELLYEMMSIEGNTGLVPPALTSVLD